MRQRNDKVDGISHGWAAVDAQPTFAAVLTAAQEALGSTGVIMITARAVGDGKAVFGCGMIGSMTPYQMSAMRDHLTSVIELIRLQEADGEVK